jgi:hypothetical protein
MPRLIEFSNRQHIGTAVEDNSVSDVAELMYLDVSRFTNVDVAIGSLKSEPLIRRDGFSFSGREVSSAHDVEG